MSLWVDKHRPNSLEKLDFHKSQALHLKSLVNSGDFPHLLVYGPPGAGKKTRVLCLLRELYGAGVERLRMEQVSFTTPSNKKIELMTISSNYHIEVNPSDVGIYDRIVIQDLIKTVAQTQQLDSSGQKEFKVVVLTEVDRLTKDAQHALRRTMEKYVSSCRLILIANSTSRVIPAIRSRCLGIRVSAPTKEKIVQILQTVARKESTIVSADFAGRIVDTTGRNVRRALLVLEAAKIQQYPFEPNQTIPEPDWQVYLRDTAKMIVTEMSPHKVLEVRERLYETISHGVPPHVLFKCLLEELVKNCDMQLKTEVLEYAALYEHRMHQGNKHIYHLEAFVARFMAIYKKFLDETTGSCFS